MTRSGYSGTPLAAKLGYKAGVRAFVAHAPCDYDVLIAPAPAGVVFVGRLGRDLDMVHGFFTERVRFERALEGFARAIKPSGMIWISWPKKASRAATDITEDVVRAAALPLGLVDVKVCAVDAVWSGLKLVWRKERRGQAG